MTQNLIERLKQLRAILKSGDYDGADLMRAWCAMMDAVDALEADSTRISTLTAALEEARKRFQMIADFGDPFEISQEPEEFGGTDDGTETVCMVYENMQLIAENALRSISATLTKGEGDKT